MIPKKLKPYGEPSFEFEDDIVVAVDEEDFPYDDSDDDRFRHPDE